MGVGADHEAHAPIEEIGHGLFLARGLGVHVDDDRIAGALERIGGELALDRSERIVHRIHEDAAHAG